MPPEDPTSHVTRLAEGVAFFAKDSDRANAYHPSLSLLSAHEWLVTFDLGTSTDTLDYHTRALRTLDRGATWVDEGPLVSKPTSGPTTHTIRTRHLGGGRVVGFGKWENREGYEKHRSNRETLGQVPMRLFWIDSLDGGRNWTIPRWIDPPLVGPTWELCHPIIVLADRRWAAPVATWRGWHGELPNGEISGLLVSPDEGLTWPQFVPTFDGRKEGFIHWEQSVVARRDGSLIATAWVYDPGKRETRPSVFALSRDGGRSFGVPAATGFLAQTCKIIELKSGKIVAAYRRHDQPGLWVELAAVDERGWRTERRAVVWAGASGMTGTTSASEQLSQLRFGYPSLAELDDGSVLLAFWGTKSDRSAIYWLRFTFAT